VTDRVFKVWNNRRGDWIVVSDARDVNEGRPHAAVFPFGDLYDRETQTRRAHGYADYLNKLNEAAKVAYDQIHLVDVLKR
jgi:hypothetical protein